MLSKVSKEDIVSILVVGSIALDSIRTPAGARKEILGGSATFFSLAARHFTPVRLVAVVGEDFPPEHERLLRRKGIDLAGLEKISGRTFRWKASYVKDINNPKTLDTQLNVFGQFKPKIPKKYKNSKCLFLANIDPDLQLEIIRQSSGAKIIASDSMNYWINTKKAALRRVLKKVDIFFANDTEAKMLSEDGNLLKAAKHLIKSGPKVVVIKKGEHGVLVATQSSFFLLPAYLLENVVDPTGAGDTFAGGFMGYVAGQSKINKDVLRKAAAYGTVLASFACESFSVDKLAGLTKAKMQKRYREFEGLRA